MVKVISGGQTGVDRAALDEALELGLEIGGYCPRGRKAEDGRIPDKYPLLEMTSSDYVVRTRQNILRSDHTLILFSRPMTPGTRLTERLCEDGSKSFTKVDLGDLNDSVYEQVRDEIKGVEVLNVAGPRESKRPGVYKQAREFMRKVLESK